MSAIRTFMEGNRSFVFLDTSVWIAAILSDRGASYVIIEQARLGEISVASSPDVFEEATRNLRVKYPSRLSAFVETFEGIHPHLVLANKKTIIHSATIVHPDDALILAAAMESDSAIFITLDRKHFIDHEQMIFRKTGIKVMTPGTFLQTHHRGK